MTSAPASSLDTSALDTSPYDAAAHEARVRQRTAAAVLALAAVLPAGRIDAGPVLCPVRRATGRPCPGCGLTRSLVRLVHGRLRAATQAHAFGPALAVLLLAWAVTGERSAGTALDPRTWTADRRRQAALAGVAALWLGWAARRARQ